MRRSARGGVRARELLIAGYVVRTNVPAPGSAAVLAVLGLAATRRRR